MKVDGVRNPALPSRAHSRPPRASTSEQSTSDAFSQSPVEARDVIPVFRILGSEVLTPQETLFLQRSVETAVSFFQKHFGDVTRPVTLNVEGAEGSLRTGFHIPTDTINFPADSLGERTGLNSRDIIAHEVFHALTLQSYPHLCSKELTTQSEFVRLHEGLADYFTHQLYPDPAFAEDARQDGKPLREYRNARKISLSPGGHAQGNAITSYLLKHKIEPTQIRDFLAGEEFSLDALGKLSPDLEADLKRDASLHLADVVSNYPESSLRKYRIQQGKPLLVRFEANDALREDHPSLQIEWVKPSGLPAEFFVVEQTGEAAFEIEASGSSGAEKLVAVFKDGEDVIGARPFYFGTSLKSEKDVDTL